MSEETVVLGGRYRLGKILGTGGMAEVFLAEDTRLHRTVAVKVLRADLARDANFQERFRREAHSAASLNHPSIVAVYDTGEEQQSTVTGAEITIPFIVMEYVQGRTLRELIDPEHPMDAHQAGEIMAALLSALEYSHRAGIVHRDIKPGNIMIDESGTVKVMDFGIARAIADATSAMTATQAVMGTAQYLSPEQARGQLVDARSDIYSAACVMYEMLTGRPPFTGDTPVSIAYQHVREEPHPPSAYNPAIVPAMDAVILTGLTKDREARYPSAVAFSRDIAAVVSGRAPALVSAAASGGEDPEATTVLGPVGAATEALPLGAGAAAGMAAQNWSGSSATTPTTGPLALHTAEEVEPAEEERRRPWWLIILVIIAVLALVGAALAVLRPWDQEPETVTVPAVVGETEEDAGTILREQGLDPQFTQVESAEVEAGLVISTDPGEGEEVSPGATVAVSVSSGPEATEVPDVVDMSREDAEQALEDAGLVAEYVDSEDTKQKERGVVVRSQPAAGSSAQRGDTVQIWDATGSYTVPDVTLTDVDSATATLEDIGFTVDTSERADGDHEEGTVLEQTPPSGSSESIGATIRLVVAAPQGPVAVPNVTGQTLADARTALSDAGFGHESTEEHSDSVEEGRVIRTEPGANEEVERGSTITIVVSSGPEPTPDPTPTEEPSESPTEEPSETPSETESDSPGNSGNGNGNGNAGTGQGTGNG
ncbi:Stk1 family PASTA domain-containing Ser/Thr kinase [Brachybacterium saurashtrense]|uniref:non-specific serine/threonine protein kinase n=1 Tax=Brachybacterium saurashtrense TaxID=556288 RepID=A0A345YQB6_9MICO|nr:Stk1 family PASTA domain-containing Ser/Thr kinase [Brachybacterium saurashtrense]AXK46118.1 Stk1 family PASTA domain-containing Ser/Thr kinase [Brachybacterium saurashtrense]RRR23858.1 Stk1 family PASTA domain-containing Ser/Thr kinase [Brachybacterium saurashtrense]